MAKHVYPGATRKCESHGSWTQTHALQKCPDCAADNRRKRQREQKRYYRKWSWQIVSLRDGMECRGCGRKCEPPSRWPNKSSATVDHIESVAKGGADTLENVQILCMQCNSIKEAGTMHDLIMRNINKGRLAKSGWLPRPL